MARSKWTEHDVAWDDVADDDRTMHDEPTISFIDNLDGGPSYDLDAS